METIKEAWPIIQQLGAAGCLVCAIWLYKVLGERDEALRRIDEIQEQRIKDAQAALPLMEQNAALQEQLVKLAARRRGGSE